MNAKRPHDLRNCAFGGLNSPALAANFSIVGLYNDTSAPYNLVIRDFNASLVTANAIGWYITSGAIGANVTRGVTAFSGEKAIAGQLQVSQIAALPTAIARITIPGNNFYNWLHDWPVAVIDPGSTFVVACLVVNVTVNASFWWEQFYAQGEWDFALDQQE